MDQEKIQRVTKDYWDRFGPAQIDEAMRYYVCEPQPRLGNKSLLEAELEFAGYARQEDDKQEDQTCETLVLLVGFSLEPLLQSVCVYKPQKVVLLLNEKPYQMGKGKRPKKWHAYARHLTEAVGHLVQQGLLDREPEFPGQDGKKGYPVADSPEAVFQKLVEVLKNEQDVVIDVTGGKKSMVSGAYLYAAYAGTRISYVDFDEYDPDYRRPYGFSCKIDGIANPYEAFALREWERVQEMYGRYQFREALQIVKNEILPAIQQWTPEAKEAAEQITRALEFYELWDSGDYRAAYQCVPASLEPPTAVKHLGDEWFEFDAEGAIVQKPHQFYGDKDKVKVYACDELARIDRLIRYNEDYRSAFLRAAGLSEVVLVARLAEYADESVRESLLDALDLETPSAGALFRKPSDGQPFSWHFKKQTTKQQFGSKLNITITTQMDSWWSGTPFPQWEDFLDHRNRLAHTYFSVPQKLAENALIFVKTNVEDFWGRSVEELCTGTEALPWNELCKLTGIDKFLPPNLRK